MKKDNLPEFVSLDTALAQLKNDQQVAEEVCKNLTPGVKDAIYRKLWFEHVAEDVRIRIRERLGEVILPESVEAIVIKCANRYVYNGDYDNEYGYWDNLDNLINDELNFQQFRDEELALEGKTELAVKAGQNYILICKNDMPEYDYSIFGEDYKLVDGGVLFTEEFETIFDVLANIMSDINESVFMTVDYDDLVEKTDVANMVTW